VALPTVIVVVQHNSAGRWLCEFYVEMQARQIIAAIKGKKNSRIESDTSCFLKNT
jgi:heterodisulfide reductase subunit A-like polyferredoxin